MAKLGENWAEMEKKLKKWIFFQTLCQGHLLRKNISHKLTLSEYMTIY